MQSRDKAGLATRRAPKWTERLALAYFLGIVTVYLAAIIYSPHPPMLQDLPTWSYEGVALSHLLTGHTDLQFTLKHYPVPNTISDIGLALLTLCFGWAAASKLWIALYLFFSSIAWLYCLRSTQHSQTLCLILGAPIAIVNLCFWYGFINFQIGLGLTWILCSLLQRNKLSNSLASALLILIFLSHAVTFMFCILVLLSYVVAKRSYRLLYSLLPSSILWIWYILGRFVWAKDHETGMLPDTPIHNTIGTFLAFKMNTFFKSLAYVNPLWHGKPLIITLLGERSMQLLIGICFVLGVTLLYLFAGASYIAYRDRSTSRFMWAAIGLSGLIAFICPSQAFGLSDPGARFLVCALSLSLLIASPQKALVRIAVPASVLLGVLGMYLEVVISQDHTVVQPPRRATSASWREFAHVEPGVRQSYYDALKQEELTLPVFNTSLFLNKDPASSNSAKR